MADSAALLFIRQSWTGVVGQFAAGRLALSGCPEAFVQLVGQGHKDMDDIIISIL